jgi:lipoate-protein ligase A
VHFTYIDTGSINPALHCALDEVLTRSLAKGQRGPTFRFWEWETPCVVFGSSQSVSNEINVEQAKEHGIQLVRRISGGGAMFMEPGTCVTWSMVVPTDMVKQYSFKESYKVLNQWYVDGLNAIGIQAGFAGINDIVSPNGKIAGSAQKRIGKGVLHHVTSAYSINQDSMFKVLRIGMPSVAERGLRSAKKPVDPMVNQTERSRSEVIAALKDEFAKYYELEDGELTPEELAQAQELVETKFSNPEWVFRLP